MEEEGSLACLCPDGRVRFGLWLEYSNSEHTYEEECRKHDRWNACDVNGDVDLYIA